MPGGGALRNTPGFPAEYRPGEWGLDIYPGRYAPGWWGDDVSRTPVPPPPPFYGRPWAPTPPGPGQIGIAERIAARRAQEEARRLAEQAEARERAAREARERQAAMGRSLEQSREARRAMERARQQQAGQQGRLRLLAEQRREQERGAAQRQQDLLEQQRRLRERMEESRREAGRRGGSTLLGDILAGTVSPRFRYHTLRQPSPPFARTGLQALANLKMREVFAARFAIENVAFWSNQVAQTVANVIGCLGAAGAAGQMARSLTRLPVATRLPGVSVGEIGAGDLSAALHLQGMGAEVIAIEPEARFVPAAALRRFLTFGGKWLGPGKTARDVASKSLDHVVQYFPFRFRGEGYAGHGTWEAAEQGIRIARRTATFVTEDPATAYHLVKQASQQPGVDRVVWIKSTAGEAAPGATGAGVPGVPEGGRIAPDHPVDMVVVFLAR